MATLEQIIDEVRSLTPAEKQKLRQALDRELEEPAPPQSSKPGYSTNEQERAWVEAHRDEYLGQWVALDGDFLIAHGTDARSVYDEARSRGITSPYLVHVAPKVEAYVGGW